jgi:multiple sugar transport system permease protein
MNTRRLENGVVTGFTVIAALVWVFPLYWALVTSLRSENRVVSRPGLLPDEFNISNYADALFNTQLLTWYINSVGTAVIVTAVVILSA